MLYEAADRLVTNPLVRWSWTTPTGESFSSDLSEFRPADPETVAEMMAGRYLFASKLVDTQGGSPFDVTGAHADWRDELETFGWLRHFRAARGTRELAFARYLVLEWIDRHGRFDRTAWAVAACARRVMNWLRHYSLLMDGADPETARLIARSLALQVQSLKLRGLLAGNPVDALMAAIALVGVGLADDRRQTGVEPRLGRLSRLLDRQIDEDGLHLTRSARMQLMLLVELITIRQSLRGAHDEFGSELGGLLDSMHRALDAISLGTGEPGYFNGTGQLPHDLVVAVQAQSTARARLTGTAGGYGRLLAGKAVVVADSGLVPPLAYAADTHAGGLAFEFSYGRDLIVCNCGPAPEEIDGQSLLFRQGIAHSCPTINALSSTAIVARGALAGYVLPIGGEPVVLADAAEPALVLRTHGYEGRFGIILERHLTLLAEGKSLVGQDRFVPVGGRRLSGVCAIRFHLAHQTLVQQVDDVVRLRLPSGRTWNFLWESAELRIEDSVRQSALFGYHRTRQLVLETHVADSSEVSWIFTLDEG
jgi:uncharacterized heparinase superfamily protein